MKDKPIWDGSFTLFSKIYAMKTLRVGNFTLEKLRKKLKDLKGKEKNILQVGTRERCISYQNQLQ